MAAKRRTPPPRDKSSTPLDARQKALAEEEAKIRTEIERRQRLIEKAPEIAKEQARRRREEYVNRASRTEARPGSRVTLPDRRFNYELNAAIPARQKTMRAERRQGRLMFFFLLFVFAGLVYWLYYTVIHS